ncbi:Gfo/Idh/MocA family protein [Paenibacillus sp. V4I7]|uniref:Gfo/Idh/MocA family protein n=1 Tax=Paenibacillus sp. V4I7 TaxID=3042307 RepID=UPI0027824C64|nr:Gfo/Idh/MocA family oxidoreductase [Paenibacillus sp. V4I7]MDQ0899564.1 putative dehydrogenase [Paenibacillus sp. V4I7]
MFFSRNEARVKAIAKQENCACTTVYQELIHSPDVNIVCVTTSSGSHARIGLDVLNAGKHLVMEKPIAMNTLDAEELVPRQKNVELQKMRKESISFLREWL